MRCDLTNEASAPFARRPETRPDSAAGVRPHGFCVQVDELSRRVKVRGRGDIVLLDGSRSRSRPESSSRSSGPSGAGKTMLLEAIAGIAPTSGGSVSFDGIDLHATSRKFRGVIGYVPQDDIIHADLPLRHTLRYAARLRLPSRTTAAEVDAAVRGAIDAVGLTEQADVRVASLSGGQRKRASVAVELLTEPRVLFLDEPTSGLDPATSAELIGHVRGLADRSATVVFTTHSVADLALCDRVVFLARGGRVGFVGTVDEALEHFDVGSVPELYRRLTDPDVPSYAGAAEHRATRRRRRWRDREQATRRERVHAMGGAHTPSARDIRAQPVDARDPARLAGARRRHVRRSLPPRRVRFPMTRARARW